MANCSNCKAEIASDSLFCARCGAPVASGEPDDLLASAASDPTGVLDRLRAATEREFTIIRELGRGGMGRVFLAHEIALERRVAMKVLPPAFGDHPEIIERFQREARTAGRLSHPNIVPVYQVSERAGLYFFTMPYVAGPSLRQILRKTPRLEVDLALRYFRQAAEGLSYAHTKGVIHRDIKPENMLMEGSRDGRLMLTDFGIAKAIGTATTLTRPGDMMGTPYFMSPEQCGESENIDGRSDQYSLGLVGYEMLAGRFPFSADSLAGIVYKHLHEYPQPLGDIRPDLPEGFRHVIERAIHKDPDERFPTMGALLEELAQPGGSAIRRRGSAGARKERGRRRRPTLAAALVGFAIIAAGAVIWQQRLVTDPAEDARLARLGEGGQTASGEGGEDPTFTVVPAEDSLAAGQPPDSAAADVSSERTPADDVEQRAAQAEAGTSDQLRAARSEAEAAQAGAEQARQAARDAGADTLFSERYAEIEAQFQQARTALLAGQIVVAATGFGAATHRFDDLAEEARGWAAPVESEPQQGSPAVPDSGQAGADVMPEDSLAAGEPGAGEKTETVLTPEQAIRGLIEIYRQAIEAEDLARLELDVYQQSIPSSDREILVQIFDRAENLDVDMEILSLDISDGAAQAAVTQSMRYLLAATRETRSHKLELRLYFQLLDGDWRLRNFER